MKEIVGERCPAIFGDFECPSKFECIDGKCLSKRNETAPKDCLLVECSSMTKCYKVWFILITYQTILIV